jgi:hypothetical protein
VLVTWHHFDKTPEQIDIKEARFVLVHSFRGFSSLLLEFIVLGMWLAEHHGREHVEESAAHLMATRKQKEVKGGRDWE